MVSAVFTALAGGLYALWFGDLDPIFQFSILTGSYMVLMALLGGVRNLFGPLLGALIVGSALEYFKVEFGNTPLHLVATGLLLGLVVMFMPDGVLPAPSASLVPAALAPTERELDPRGDAPPNCATHGASAAIGGDRHAAAGDRRADQGVRRGQPACSTRRRVDASSTAR